MDLKAYNKLYGEAVEAIAEKRFNDALALTEALSKDLQQVDHSALIADIAENYKALVDIYLSNGTSKEYETLVNKLYGNLIQLLEVIRTQWQSEHQVTSYGRIASQMTDLGWKDFLGQIQRTRRSKLGNHAYHDALDAAFGMAWYCDLHFDNPEEKQKIGRSDYFVQRTLVGGLLLGVLDCFTPGKILLLLTLAKLAEKDISNAELLEDKETLKSLREETGDLLARVAVALTIIYQKYQVFFPYFPELQEGYQHFFRSTKISSELPQLLRAFVCQSLTPHVGQQMEDIMKVVKDIVEKQQPHLGRNIIELDGNDEWESGLEKNDQSESEKQDKPKQGFKMEVMHINLNQGDQFFSKMADYAQTMDVLLMNDMDINYTNSIHLKHFNFFHHPAHWFYPFCTLVPDIQKGIILQDGKLDTMSLNIMEHSRFCDSDRYSYASMMSYLRRDGKKTISDQLRDELEAMKEDNDSEDLLPDEETKRLRLNPYVNFCQGCYRFFRYKTNKDIFTDLLNNNDDTLLPLQVPFQAYFNEYGDIEKSVETYLLMGDGEHVVVLLNYFMEHHGSTAKAFQQRGRAYMQLKQWRNAISDFQQSMLIEEDPETRFYITRCFEAINEWDRALPLLLEEEKAQEQQDADLIEEISRCLLQMKRWDEASQRFFQLELMGQHLSVCRRGIGWCSLHQGKYERAEQYYKLLIDNSKKASWEDLINMGHASLLLGKREEAIVTYKQSVMAFNRSKKVRQQHFRHWTEAFHEDAADILCNQFSELELAIIQDAVTMK